MENTNIDIENTTNDIVQKEKKKRPPRSDPPRPRGRPRKERPPPEPKPPRPPPKSSFPGCWRDYYHANLFMKVACPHCGREVIKQKLYRHIRDGLKCQLLRAKQTIQEIDNSKNVKLVDEEPCEIEHEWMIGA